MEFKKYQHIERLGTSEVTGLTKGMCYIFPKIDGVNTQVYLNGNKEICAAGRKQEMSKDTDSTGFLNYISNNQNIKSFFEKYPNYRLFGEWLIPCVIRTYNTDAWNKFYIFDVMNENNQYLTYNEYKPMLQEFNLDFIPLIETINNPTTEQIFEIAKNTHFLQNDSVYAEGVVIKNYNFVNKYGHVKWGKLVLSEFFDKKLRRQQKQQWEQKQQLKTKIEDTIIENFITDAFILKEVSKLLLQKNSEWQDKFIGEFLGRAWCEFIREESFNIVRKYKMPTINFQVLNKLFNEKCKQIIFNRNQTDKGV